MSEVNAGHRLVHRIAWGIFVCFLLAYLLPSALRPLFRPDEFRYAEIPREMVASGDWIVPRAAGMRYFEKPALSYQLTAFSFHIFGENAFALRLPCVLATGLTALFLAFLLHRARPDDRYLPLTAAGIHLTFPLVWGIGTFAVPDGPLCCALTVATGAVWLARAAKTRRSTLGWLLLAGVAAGAAFLLKGLLGFVIPALVAGGFLLWKQEWKRLFLYPLPILIAALPVVLPWSLAIHQAEPDFWHYFIVMEHWKRFTSATYDRKPQPFWYFLPVFFCGVLPGGLLAFAAKWEKRIFRDDLTLYLILWAALPFLFFSLSSCKLGSYILPCFAPVAGLLACLLSARRAADPEKLAAVIARIAQYLGIFLAAAGILALAALGVFAMFSGILAALPDCRNWVTPPLIAAAAILLISGAALFRSRRVALPCLAALAGGAFTLLMICGSAALAPLPLGAIPTGCRIARCDAVLPPDDAEELYADRNLMLPLCWVRRRTGLTLVGRPGEFAYALANYPAEYAGRRLSEEEFGSLLKRDPATPRRIYLVRRKSKPLPASWPKPQMMVDTGSVVMLYFGPEKKN